MSTFKKTGRAFLNKDGNGYPATCASFFIEVNAAGYGSSSFSIRGCSDTYVDLDLSVRTKKLYENSVHKLEMLKILVLEAQGALAEAREAYEAQESDD